jgi:hypothetical protein
MPTEDRPSSLQAGHVRACAPHAGISNIRAEAKDSLAIPATGSPGRNGRYLAALLPFWRLALVRPLRENDSVIA